MGIVQCFSRCFFATVVFILILLYVPGIPPHVDFVAFNVDPALPREGPLAKNHILDGAERLHEGQVIGPEAMASRSINEIFLSLHNGSIARVWGDNYEKTKMVATLGQCGVPREEHKCGIPLGSRFSDGKLIIADAYLGIFKLDVDTGEKVRLVDPDTPIDGVTPKIFNDLDIDKSGNIYWSDSSSNVKAADGIVELLAAPSGRLIKYDSKTKRYEVLLTNLHLANGVQLSRDGHFILVSETFRYRVHRYWLKGPKAGTSDIYVSRLPGMPDNIKPRKDGGYYISLVNIRSPDVFDPFDALSTWPGIRKVILRTLTLVKNAWNLIQCCVPSQFSGELFDRSRLFELTYRNETFVVEVNESGDIIGSLQGYHGVLKMISETQQVGDSLFFASPQAHFLGKLRVDKKYIETPTTEKEKSSGIKEEL